MLASPPEHEFALRKTTYSLLFTLVAIQVLIVLPVTFTVVLLKGGSKLLMIVPTVLTAIIIAVIYLKARIFITPESVRLDLPRNRINIDFAAIKILTLSNHGLLVAQSKYKIIYISAAWADAGAAADYVIHRLNDLGLLDSIELHGDTEKIAAVADRKERLHFQTHLQHRFLSKYFGQSGDNGGRQQNH